VSVLVVEQSKRHLVVEGWWLSDDWPLLVLAAPGSEHSNILNQPINGSVVGTAAEIKTRPALVVDNTPGAIRKRRGCVGSVVHRTSSDPEALQLAEEEVVARLHEQDVATIRLVVSVACNADAPVGRDPVADVDVEEDSATPDAGVDVPNGVGGGEAKESQIEGIMFSFRDVSAMMGVVLSNNPW